MAMNICRFGFWLALSAASFTAAAVDEREWGAIGKADAAGWLEPLTLPKGEDRVLAEFDGKIKGVVTNAVGYVRGEFEFDPAKMARKPGGYVEFYLDGVKGMLNGSYNRSCPADGKVVTRGILAMDHGTKATWGVLKPDGERERVAPLRGRLVSTSLTAALRLPEDGARLNDNTPDFVWYTDDPQGVVLELSDDCAFPPGDTLKRVCTNDLPFFTAESPLKPGRWYWRVTTASGFVTPVRSFVQTASAADDCTGPELHCAPRFMSDAAKPYGFTVGSDTVRVTARIVLSGGGETGLDARCRGTVAGVRPPQGGWPIGVSRLLLTAEDKRGNTARATAWVSHAPNLPQVRWGGEGEAVTVGGRPFELVALYGVDREDDLDRVRALGFNCVHSYARDGAVMNGRIAAFLDALEARDMKTYVSFHREDVRRARYSRIAEKIGFYLPRRCLLAWYLSDEPETHDFRPVPPKVFKRYRDFVRALDPTRPGLLTHNIISCGAQRYLDCKDVHLSQLYRATVKDAEARYKGHRKWLDASEPSLKYSIIVNPRAAKSAEEFATQIDYARQNGCGVFVYAWFEALRNKETMSKLEEGMDFERKR